MCLSSHHPNCEGAVRHWKVQWSNKKNRPHNITVKLFCQRKLHWGKSTKTFSQFTAGIMTSLYRSNPLSHQDKEV